MSKKSIKIISFNFPPEKGAASHRILVVAKELKSYGFNVSVVTPLPNYPTGKLFNGYKGSFYLRENIDGINCFRCWILPSNSNNPFIRILSMLSYSFSLLLISPLFFFNKPDIFIIQSPPLLPALTGLLISKIIGSKSVLNVSDIWPLTAVDVGVIKQNSISFKLFSKVEKYMYKLSNAFIAQSNETVDYLHKFSTKPILLYRNLTRPNFNKDFDFHSIRKNKKVVYAGLLGLAQGVYGICKNINFKSLNIEFHIFGDGVERSKILKYVKNNPNSNIYIHESLPKRQMQDNLLNYDATIISLKSNIYGAFPSKITMAMAAALPIIFSGDGEGSKIVKEFELGYISKAGDMDGLKNSLIKFSKLKNADILKIKQNIKQKIEEEFNFEAQQVKLCDFINKISSIVF